ncbi:MAG: terminase family protein [Armatimonadota bacterium]
MKQLVERVAGRLRFNLHWGQTKAYDCLARFILVLAGTQSGKTSFGPLWLYKEICRLGPGDYLAASVNYDLFKLKMLPELQHLFCTCLGWKYLKGDRIIQSPDGLVRIIIRSAEAPAGLESSTAKAAWLDEWGHPDVDIDCWYAVLRRLSLAEGRVLVTTTPYDLGWLYCEFYKRWLGGNPDYAVISFRSIDNPVFPRKEYERAKRDMPSWKFEMMYNGVFTKPAGLIYSDYDEAKHLVRAFSIPKDWPRHTGLDFGGVHPALVWLAEEPSAQMYFLYREHMGDTLTIAERCRNILEYHEPVVTYAGGAPSENEVRWQYNEAGVPVVEPYLDGVEVQIDRVISLFKQDRLFVFETCAGVRSELGSYSRELDAAGEPTPKIANKAKYHRLDALRGIVTTLPVTAEEQSSGPKEYRPRVPEEQDVSPMGYDIYDQIDMRV